MHVNSLHNVQKIKYLKVSQLNRGSNAVLMGESSRKYLLQHKTFEFFVLNMLKLLSKTITGEKN